MWPNPVFAELCISHFCDRSDWHSRIQPRLELVSVLHDHWTGPVEAQVAEVAGHAMIRLTHAKLEAAAWAQVHSPANVHRRPKEVSLVV